LFKIIRENAWEVRGEAIVVKRRVQITMVSAQAFLVSVISATGIAEVRW